MRQVLWNLVRNGVIASGAGSTVTITVEEDGDRVRMRVIDEGPGLSPEALTKIFDAFYTTRSQGTGIGLAVVRRIIDDHARVGATLKVTSGAFPSPAGRGATFEVGLARAEAPARRGASEPTVTPSSEPQ